MNILTLFSIFALVLGVIGLHEYTSTHANSPIVKIGTFLSLIFLYLLSGTLDFHSFSFGFNVGAFLSARLWFPVRSVIDWSVYRQRQAYIKAFERQCEQAHLDSLRIPEKKRVIAPFTTPSKQDQERLANRVLSGLNSMASSSTPHAQSSIQSSRTSP